MFKSIDHHRATFDGPFWCRRLEANRKTTLPIEYEQCRKTGRIDAFRLAWKEGQPHRPHVFWDSDVAKWIEAAACSLASHPDARLRRRLDAVVDLIAGAQQPDGYLNTHYIVVEPGQRWTNLRDCHELYCAGHLIEAAVAHYKATGSRKLLDVLCRYADHIAATFGRGKGKRRGYCGHEEIELALVALYRATGNARHLSLAKYFIDERGRRPWYFDLESRARGADDWKIRRDSLIYGSTEPYAYLQAHQPVREQTRAVGHAVRAMYLYSGMADVAAETGDRSLLAACRRLWLNVVERNMYVTGGIGSSANGERFTFDYDLPNESAYAETCAAIGLVFFASRMLNLDLDGRYGDVLERTLYNGVLGGVSLDGRTFFYANALAVGPEEARDRTPGSRLASERQEWFDCACCPPNVARLLASLGRYAYSEAPRAVAVHLYAAGSVLLNLSSGPVRLEQTTQYPWDGRVSIAVKPATATRFTLALRIPEWCRRARLNLNGRPVMLGRHVRRGYARLTRTWTAGDRLDLDLPMPIERMEAHPAVRMNCGRVALQRGPLVYCLEEIDNGPRLNDLELPADARLSARFVPRSLGGMVVISGRALRRRMTGWERTLYRASPSGKRSQTITAIPYMLRANRKPGEMLVWVNAAR